MSAVSKTDGSCEPGLGFDYSGFRHMKFAKSDMKLPSEDATLDDLIWFALSFKGYEYAGGVEELGGVDGLWDRIIPLLNEDKLDDVSIEDIRACMFWLQRSDRWSDTWSDIEDYQFFVDKLRKKGYT